MPRLAIGHVWVNCVFVLRNLQIFDFLVAVAFVAATANLLQYRRLFVTSVFERNSASFAY